RMRRVKLKPASPGVLELPLHRVSHHGVRERAVLVGTYQCKLARGRQAGDPEACDPGRRQVRLQPRLLLLRAGLCCLLTFAVQSLLFARQPVTNLDKRARKTVGVLRGLRGALISKKLTQA